MPMMPELPPDYLQTIEELRNARKQALGIEGASDEGGDGYPRLQLFLRPDRERWHSHAASGAVSAANAGRRYRGAVRPLGSPSARQGCIRYWKAAVVAVMAGGGEGAGGGEVLAAAAALAAVAVVAAIPAAAVLVAAVAAAAAAVVMLALA